VRLLERLGHRVDFPLAQTCCGQMHYNSGYHREAAPLALRMARIFADSEIVVAPSTSCVAMIRQHYPKIARTTDPISAADIESFAPRVFELSEFLVGKLGALDVGAYYPHRVTYHASCNSLRALGLDDAPIRLLESVRGLDYVGLSDIRECCGFGGTFAVKNADTSAAMMDDKIRAVLDTGAAVCTAADNSCLMQIGGGLSRRRAGVRTAHLAEILASTEGAPP
jgi:L-lactate dehydrogenase complex protein LldE